MRREKGITLISLLITIVVMLIIASVAIGSGTQSIDNTKLDAFYMQLDIIKKRVDDIATTNENYIDSTGNTIYLKEQGRVLTSEQQNNLSNIIQSECSGSDLQASNFKYFTTEGLDSILGLSNIDYNVFIDFNTRTVIAEIGVIADGVAHHTSPSESYFVEENTNKNIGVIKSLSYNISEYGSEKYKITVIPSNTVGDLNVGILKYKKSDSQYWETSNDLTFIASELIEYDIKYEDASKNSISETIKIELNEDNTPTIKIVTD